MRATVAALALMAAPQVVVAQEEVPTASGMLTVAPCLTLDPDDQQCRQQASRFFDPGIGGDDPFVELRLSLKRVLDAAGEATPIRILVRWPKQIFRGDPFVDMCLPPEFPEGETLTPGGLWTDTRLATGLVDLSATKKQWRAGWQLRTLNGRVAAGRIASSTRIFRWDTTERIWDYNFDRYFNICLRQGIDVYAKDGHLYCDWYRPGRARWTVRIS